MKTFVCSGCDEEGKEGKCASCGAIMMPLQSLSDLKMSDIGGKNFFVCIGDPNIAEKFRRSGEDK